MTLRHAVQLLGPAFTAGGLALSIYGTFLLTRWYHPFSASGFFSTLWNVILLCIKGDADQVFREAKTATRIASANEEEKAKSLVGVYFIFLGFVLEVIGTGFWTIDAVLGVMKGG